MTLNVKLTHPKVDQPFVAHTQKQIADPKTNPTED
jgi:hypothetical protein